MIAKIENRVKKSNNKKISTAKKNKVTLNIISRQKHENEEIIDEETLIKLKSTHRHFNCPDCVRRADLYGEAEQDKCTSCLSKENDT